MYLNPHPDLAVKRVISMAKVTRCLLRRNENNSCSCKTWHRNARMFLVVAVGGRCFYMLLTGCYCYVVLKCSEVSSLKMPQCPKLFLEGQCPVEFIFKIN